MTDPFSLLATRHQELLQQAEQERLAARLPRRCSAVRRSLALACRHLATLIDDPAQYVRLSEAGLADWEVRSLRVYIRGADSVTAPAARDSLLDVRRTNFVSR